ncbi:hypothetical protein FGIG_05807 [Fasciola gigantica]|uniref:Uncharacterized protein n=1 Tax=Fasciola gigantica TaxID=46835 RepID=A0A504YU65_FASGI|nr:hypothetical protein FGIG_05807 [Fasciola gigantica]
MDEQVLPSNEAVVGGVEEDEEDEDPEEEEEIEEEEEEASENVPEEGSTVSSNAVPVNKCDQLILGIAGSATSEPLHQVQSTAISMDSS